MCLKLEKYFFHRTIATIQWVLPLDHLLFQAPYIFSFLNSYIILPTLQIGKNGSRTVAWLAKLVSVRVRNRKHMSIKALSPAVLNSSSPQCLRSSVLPGAKAVRTGFEDHYYLTIMYLKNYFLNNSTANRTHPQVWLHFFFFFFFKKLPQLLCRKNMFNYPGDA